MLCRIDLLRDSRRKLSVIVNGHEQADPFDLLEDEPDCLQRAAEVPLQAGAPESCLRSLLNSGRGYIGPAPRTCGVRSGAA